MSIVYLVLPLALVIVLAAVLAFVWAAKAGQFDDLQTPALRMMHDDEALRPSAPPAPAPGSTAAGPTPEDGARAGRPDSSAP